MKARINYRSKRTIIIISIAVVLLIAAIAGTVAFVKGNRDSAAAMTDDNPGTSQNDGTNAGLPNNGDQNDGSDQNNDGTTLPTDGDNTNPADSNNNDNNGSTTNDGTTGTNGANGSTTGTTNGANTGANAGTTTGTTTAGNNGANVPNQDYTQTTTVITENPWETKEVGWSPISVAAYTAASKLKVHKPDLDLQKYAYLDGDSLDELPVNTAVQKGETITYVIKITNKGNEDANGIRTIDSIPEGTELAPISEGGALNNDGKIVWKNDIKAGETVTVSFKVVVTADSIDLINNIAKVNGEETPETKTPVITANKTAQVVKIVDKEEVLENRDAKVGETIRYTITAKNTTEVDGTTVIKDSIPDGTSFVDGTITEKGNFDKENGTITWNNVVVPAKGEVSVSFDVVVNEKTTEGEVVKSVSNTATIGNTPTEEVETKVANITTVKTSEGIHADGTPVTEENPLHELDKITYTLIATNIGNGKGTVKISDTVPEGTTLVADSIKIGNDTYTEKELNEGIDVTLEAGEKKSITFIVTINPFKDEKIVVRNADAKQDEKEVPPTDDEVIKEYVSIDVNKEFVDKENVDELRPTEIVVALYKNAGDATHIDTRTLNEQNNWKASFTNLDKYDFETQELIKYDAKELNVDKNYTASYEKNKEKNNITLKITNTLKYESVLTNITANKVWNDNENKVGARKSVTFELYADGVATGKTQTATADDWTVEFKNVQKYNKDGSEIKYTVIETTQVEHYNKPAYSDNGLTVTNTIDYTTFKTSVLATKKWIDPENAKRPEVTINLYQNGSEDVYATYTLKNGETSHEFTNLPKYDENGNEYLYTVEEAEVEGYTPEYSNDTLTITNVINQENTVKISGTKTWIAPEGKAFPTITIKLYKNGIFENKVELTNGTTNYEFNNLPKYKVDENGQYELDENGNVQLNVYTVEEADVKGYTSKKAENGFDFTNTINQEKITINGTKTWIDPQGTTHDPITINLLRDGKKMNSTTLANGTTSYEFKDLDRYDLSDGHEYVYKVEEINVKGYQTSYAGEYNEQITNTINQEKLSINGTKTWIDPQGTTHNPITINLLRDGKNVDHVTLANGTTTYKFENLDKFAQDGHIYKYTIVEEAVEGYTPTYSGEYNENITNTINQDNTVSVTGVKIWVDPQGTTHNPITINLLRDGKNVDHVTLANGTTNYKFENLDKYAPDGHIYKYTVSEDAVDGYQTTYGENTITNTINQEKLSINGTKTWIDPQGTEHKEITVNLLRDNEKVNSVTLANGTTNYEFKDLDKYATDGHIYNYKVEEENVSGYTTSYTGEYNENITNTINQEKVSINGEKKWVAPTGTKFPTITINLLRDGEKVDSKELVNGTTSYSFENLDRYDLINGHEYEYTVSEEKVEGYTTSYSDDKKSTITNTIEQKYKTISGTKTWIAPAGTIYPNIEITLYRNGEEYKTITLESGKTSYEFKDLETYAPDGSIYNYSVEETKLSNYTSEKAENGVDFINTIKQEQVSVRGSKTWVIPAGKIVPTITINLLRDGEKVNSVELTNGTTSYSFENLDRYDLTDGHEYKYTVSEETVEGYKSEQNENNFTNTIEQDNTVIVSGNKTWVTPVGTTHPTVTINLLKNGEQYKTTTIANGNTTYEFTGLPKYKTDANGNFVLDVNGNIELNEYTVEEAELNGYTSEKAANGVDFVNTIDQELISISGEKTWVDPEGTTLVHPEITINLIKNGTKASAIKLANGNTKYEFTELPKYKTDENGKYVLDSNGNVQLNRYTIEEENVRNYTTSYNGYNITNTFKQDIQGTVEITTTTTSQTSVKTPLDVVFVLDISGSMNDNDKDKTMVDSVNTAISTIMNENPESRIGVVAYSSTYNSSLANANNATTLLPLGKYTPKTTGKYLTLQEGVLRANNEKYDTITTNVNEKKNQTLNVYGGTYTQAGIKEGAGILTSANTKFTTTVNGKQKEITRTPVMILLSDGDPTYYNENYTTLSGKKYGNGSDTTENEAYYTIRTANYYKQQITSHYYGTTGTKSKFYTIGLNMSGTLSETILNPTSENVNKCNDEGSEGGYFTWRNVKGKLYDKIIADGSAGKYSYADQSYVGSMTTSDLQSIFNTIINDNSTSTETRDITVEESDARRVNLEGIDTSKEFTLTIGSHSYNFAQAQTAGYVKGNNTDGYYVDISNVAKGTTISISYNK